MSQPLDVTVVLTGILPAITLGAAALTAPVSAGLLWLYRRAVLRSMGVATGSAPVAVTPSATVPSANAQPLAIVTLNNGPARSPLPGAAAVYRDSTRALWRAAAVYAIAGLAYALVLAAPWMLFTEGGFILRRLYWLVACYGWPIALAVSLVAATSWRERSAIAGVYFGVLIGVALSALAHNPQLSPGQLVFFWLFANGPGTVLLLAFLHRRVRAVGPLVLAFMAVGVTGVLILPQVAGSSATMLRFLVAFGSIFGLGATELFIALHLLGLAGCGVLGWWLLGWLGRRYRAKRTSDQTLLLDSMWLLFAVVQSITLAFQGWAWIFTGLGAFLFYKLVAWAGFAWLARGRVGGGPAPTLLLLRVFALGRRSERLFDRLSKRWLRVGSLSLIAGPDLVTVTVEPHEFFDYLGRRLARQFVQDSADLERRIAAMDRLPDPDGRYRVNEFFCHADTWQITMQRLARDADAVLMDLRSFAPGHEGCLYELEQLLAAVPLARIVFVVDDSTDRLFLERKLRELWQHVPADSPNRALPQPEARLFEARTQAPVEVRTLLQILFGLGGDEQAAH